MDALLQQHAYSRAHLRSLGESPESEEALKAAYSHLKGKSNIIHRSGDFSETLLKAKCPNYYGTLQMIVNHV